MRLSKTWVAEIRFDGGAASRTIRVLADDDVEAAEVAKAVAKEELKLESPRVLYVQEESIDDIWVVFG
jgi:hypothetical protein